MNYQKMLVPLDGSRLSESILPYAAEFAAALKTPLELLHVVEIESLKALFSEEQGSPIDIMWDDLKSAGFKYLEKVAASLPESLEVRRTIEAGLPAEIAIERADHESETLIAIATRGLSGVKPWVMGSVAAKILHATQSPLLLVKPPIEVPLAGSKIVQRVLVPLDGSELAEQILSHAKIIASALDAEIELLRVYSPVSSAVAPAPIPFYHPILTTEALQQSAEKYLAEKVEQLRIPGGSTRVSYSAARGSAADQIIETAQRNPGTLVAMSTHGRTGLRRWIMGSVAERVVHHCGSPVLVIRPTAQ